MKNQKRMNIIIMAVILIGFTIYQIYSSDKSNIRLKFDINQLAITCMDEEIVLPYHSIKNIAYTENPDLGICLEGNTTKNYQYGIWKNELWGEYFLCIYRASGTCIVIDTAEGKYVISGDSDNATSAIFKDFSDMIIK